MIISNDAQAIIVGKRENDFLFLIIKRFDKNKQIDHYRLVKGGVKRDENSEETITREVVEEVGIYDIQKKEYFCHYKYVYGDIKHEVDVFLVYVEPDDIKVDSSEEGGFTIKDAIWVSGGEAIERLNFKEEKDLIIAAIKELVSQNP